MFQTYFSLDKSNNSKIGATQAIEGIQKGDNSVIERIYADFRNDFIHWAGKRFPFEKEDLRDIFQQTVCIFYEKVVSGKIQSLDCALGTYLYAVGFNGLRAHSRKMKKIDLVPPEELSSLSAQTLHESELTFDEEEEEKAILRKALDQLPENCRNLLIMAVYDRLSNEQIMVKMGYQSKATVAVTKTKCLSKLTSIIKNMKPPKS